MNIDWSKVVTNLRAAGMSARGIAKRCRMEAQTVSHLQNGYTKDPRWTQALALLDIHADVCRDRHSLEAITK